MEGSGPRSKKHKHYGGALDDRLKDGLPREGTKTSYFDTDTFVVIDEITSHLLPGVGPEMVRRPSLKSLKSGDPWFGKWLSKPGRYHTRGQFDLLSPENLYLLLAGVATKHGSAQAQTNPSCTADVRYFIDGSRLFERSSVAFCPIEPQRRRRRRWGR